MLTRRGWILLAVSVSMSLSGRLVGVVELFMLATASAVFPLGAALYVRLTRFELDAWREVRPARVHAGGSSRVELAVRNNGSRRSPVLGVFDPFDNGRRWARFLVAPLEPGELTRAAYRLPTERRGVYDLGPLEIRLTDPFGLATVSAEGASTTRLTVFPPVVPLAPLPQTRGHDPHAGADAPSGVLHQGDEFYALREYETGDDLRRVHWPSSARRDELMIRQDEMPWERRSTVVLDARANVHSSASLDGAVSAAASILLACAGRQSLIRMVTTAGVDSGFSAGHQATDAMLEHLAEIGPSRGTGLGPTLQSLRRSSTSGALVVITTAGASDADLEAIARLRARYSSVYLVLYERSAVEPSSGWVSNRTRAVPDGVTVVRVSDQKLFTRAWTAVVGRAPMLSRRGR